MTIDNSKLVNDVATITGAIKAVQDAQDALDATEQSKAVAAAQFDLEQTDEQGLLVQAKQNLSAILDQINQDIIDLKNQLTQ